MKHNFDFSLFDGITNTGRNKSFLKWAGGKSKLTEKISYLVGDCDRLVEPFVGSGSVFLGTNYSKYLLCDTNNDLITMFNQIKYEPTPFIELVKTYFSGEYTNELQYYKLRDQFNSLESGNLKRSALFVYLNKHAFNGVCRYNSNGEFNVPYAKLKITPNCPINEILEFNRKAVYAEFKTLDFEQALALVEPGDGIYCDPPYVPMTEKNMVVSYAVDVFNNADQVRLVNSVKKSLEIAKIAVISNHDTTFTREIYKDAIIHELEVRRSISRKSTGRTNVKELMAVFNK